MRPSSLDTVLQRVFFLLFFIPVCNVSSLSILKSKSFLTGSDVKVTCSADAIDLSKTIQRVFRLRVSRKAYTAAKDAKPEILFFLDVQNLIIGLPKAIITNEPDGKTWLFDYAKESVLKAVSTRFKRDLTTVTVVMKDATCQDSGQYFCQVGFNDDVGGNGYSEKSQILNGTESASHMKLTVSPDYSVGNLESVYRAKEIIEMTCNVIAKEDYHFYWARKCPPRTDNNSPFLPVPRFIDWPVQKDIKKSKKDPEICGMHRHSQVLTFTMTSDLKDCIVQCQFSESRFSPDNLQAKFTLKMRDEADNTGDDNKGSRGTSSMSNEDLVIGLTVSFLLLSVIVVAVLIYVC